MIAVDALALDAKGKTKRAARLRRQQERQRFQKVHRAEKHFARLLRHVARQVGAIVDVLAPGGIVENVPQLNVALERYADLIRPWAQAVAASTVAEVAQRDERVWTEIGRSIGRNLAREIKQAPTGDVLRAAMEERVKLIQSLPREAAQRVHRMVIEGLSDGTRAAEYAKAIANTGQVTANRAMLIARTETTSCATNLVEARARHIGSEGYFWRTAGDADVRQEHKELDGKFIKWSEPPIAGTGKGGTPQRYHAGGGPNCRCWPDPAIPDVIA